MSLVVKRLSIVFVVAACALAACVGDTSSTADAGSDAAPDVQPDVTPTDAADGGVPDVDAGPRNCDPTKPFGTPTPVAGFATTTDVACPWLTPDELTMYIQVVPPDAGAHWYIESTSRAKTTDPFGPLVWTAANQPYNQYRPALSPDGLTMFFGFNNFVITRLWFATRSSTLADFSNPTALSGVASSNGNDDEESPFNTADGQELWFVSNRTGGLGGLDVYVAEKSGQGFANPTAVASINSTDDEYDPVLSADGLTIYFSSKRPGGVGGSDIWWSHRVSTSDSFPAPTVAAGVNSAADDGVGWLSPDECRMYLHTRRASASWQVYVAERAP